MPKSEFNELSAKKSELEIQEGLTSIFGDCIAFHHTIKRNDVGEATYTGVHRFGWQANLAKKSETKKRGKESKRADDWKLNAKVVELEIGEEYHPHGERYPLTHGEDDGYHGSKKVDHTRYRSRK